MNADMRYKLYIFDLDGTILDTLTDLWSAVNYTMRQFGYPTLTKEQVGDRTGNGIARLVKLSLPEGVDEDAQKRALAIFKQYYVEHCADNAKPYERIKDVIATLKESGAKCAVISNKADEAVQKLAKDYFDGSFDVVIGQKDGVRQKPYPDEVESVLKELGVKKQDAVYIGDSEVDVQTAKNANLDLIAVSWGFRGKARLIECGAKVIIDTPEQILEY